MAKQRKSRTQSFLNIKSTDNAQSLPSPEEVNKVIAKVTGKEEVKSEQVQKSNVVKRVPLTTAITPENRARLEVTGINDELSVADVLNEALDHYFENVNPVKDQELVNTFIQIYSRKKNR